jgi:hypothetical protein
MTQKERPNDGWQIELVQKYDSDAEHKCILAFELITPDTYYGRGMTHVTSYKTRVDSHLRESLVGSASA